MAAPPCLDEHLGDTIVAQSTAPGPAAIAIVRLSGARAQAVAQALVGGALAEPYRLSRRDLRDACGELLDEAMVVAMPKPRSATGEDLVELHLHGGPAVVAAVVEACCRQGARPAQPGEFTRRAFLHGRLDLAQAEAVGALVHAESEAARRASLALLQGGLSEALTGPLQALEGLVAQLRATLDFPDDVDSPWPPPSLAKTLGAVHEALGRLRASQADVRQSGFCVALRGGSNAGKSTLFNALLGQQRALTDAQGGTTRDAVSAPWRHAQAQAILWDTAGERPMAQGVEARGIARGQQIAQGADLVLWLLGHPAHWPDADASPADPAAALWVLGSQADRFDAAERQAIEAQARARHLTFAGWVSPPHGEGVQALAEALAGHLQRPRAAASAGVKVAMTQRHRHALGHADEALQTARVALQEAMPADCVLLDVERAHRALAGIVGRDVEAALLDRVFADFCIGK